MKRLFDIVVSAGALLVLALLDFMQQGAHCKYAMTEE